LMSEGFPEGFQLLCANCNSAKAWFGGCPHGHVISVPGVKEYRRRYTWQLRMDVLRHYGLACACCRESNSYFLSIDHMGGGGNRHRLHLGIGSGYQFYLWLRRSGFSLGYQTLCMNCNCAYGFYKYCPHTKTGNQLALF
jgi:hypothetical protein